MFLLGLMLKSGLGLFLCLSCYCCCVAVWVQVPSSMTKESIEKGHTEPLPGTVKGPKVLVSGQTLEID